MTDQLALCPGEVNKEHEMNQQKFWTSLFEEHQLASKLTEIASNGEEGKSLSSVDYADVLITCKQATVLGDGYMSDTYSICGKLKNGTTYEAFVKVFHNSWMLLSSCKTILLTVRFYRQIFCCALTLRISKCITERSACTSDCSRLC